MSEGEPQNPTIEQSPEQELSNLGKSVYVLKQNEQTTELFEARVVGNAGPRASVSQDIGEGSYSLTTQHRSNIFTPEQVAMAADDLLPTPKDGEEQLMSTALKEIVEKPESRNELIVRLAGVAMGERMNAERSMRDYGVRTLEDLVGGPDEYGTNMWKVEDLIGPDNLGRVTSNTLVLAWPEDDELVHLPAEEAAKIREQISATNRTARDKIYDHYDVSFHNATAYEKTLRNGRTARTTVYPSATESLYFVENVLDSDIETPYIQIINSAPKFSLEDGYMRVV